MTERPKLGLIDDAVSDDPFDLAKLRVSQDFLETTNVKTGAVPPQCNGA